MVSMILAIEIVVYNEYAMVSMILATDILVHTE